MQLEKLEAVLCDYLNNKELRITRQRRAILEVIAHADAHLTVEELYYKTKEKDPSIGMATVYRTINLLCECGLASGFRHGDGNFRYELEKEGHHHLICIKCRRLIEDTDPEVEVFQNKLGRKNKFKILRTRVEAYGICPECLKNG
ncbi:MAG: transcriptional repressor [Negativicutes bacterium]|nr:transcriptional repressor [Negativicutes bacterium]